MTQQKRANERTGNHFATMYHRRRRPSLINMFMYNVVSCFFFGRCAFFTYNNSSSTLCFVVVIVIFASLLRVLFVVVVFTNVFLSVVDGFISIFETGEQENAPLTMVRMAIQTELATEIARKRRTIRGKKEKKTKVMCA